MNWNSLESLTLSGGVLDYQQWALSEVLGAGTLPSVPGPFGSLYWLDDVRRWVEQVAGAVDQIVSYRCRPYEIVLGFSGGRRVFVKGLWRDRAREADVTMALAEIAPRSFARTLALRSGWNGAVWWLTDGCPGVSLAQAPTLRSAIQVMEACARLQQRLTNSEVVGLPVLDLATACGWARSLLQETGGNDVEQSCAAIERAFQDASAGVPHCWIPLDLDPGNVLLDRATVRFIDLDDSYIGPAPLAAATLVRRIRQSFPSLAEVAASGLIYDAYVKAWASARQPRVHWVAVDLVSRVLEDYLAWRRVVTMSERGEVHGLLDLARERIAHRLGRAAMHAGVVS